VLIGDIVGPAPATLLEKKQTKNDNQKDENKKPEKRH
jgi:hypothetical protein